MPAPERAVVSGSFVLMRGEAKAATPPKRTRPSPPEGAARLHSRSSGARDESGMAWRLPRNVAGPQYSFRPGDVKTGSNAVPSAHDGEDSAGAPCRESGVPTRANVNRDYARNQGTVDPTQYPPAPGT
jgi:hypothetical protein